MIPIILSGGSGTRLWPVSRQNMPKQFCSIFDLPLQTSTIKRCSQLGDFWIVTGIRQKSLTEIHLGQQRQKLDRVIYEPFGKNTAPAIAAVCHLMMNEGRGDEVLGVFPSDHLISKENVFQQVVSLAEAVAKENKVVTLGITPAYPETGYGYIQTQSEIIKQNGSLRAHPVVRFHEKPTLSKAQEFLQAGGFSWNAGIFVFKVSHMAELFKTHQPELWNSISKLNQDCSNLEQVYGLVPNISIDYAIMEKLGSTEMACIPSDMGWSDVGSWDAVSALQEGQEILSVKAQNNFVFGDSSKHYSMIGVEDVILVDTRDAVMLVKKGHSQDVRIVVDSLNKSHAQLAKEHVFEYRPWGYFEILKDTESFKSKVIRVNPQSQISYQSHAQREEHWTIVKGSGEVVLNDQVIPVKSGSHIHIPRGAKHRIRNNSSEILEFVEVQLGTYFGEDDIVRYEDDYKRV